MPQSSDQEADDDNVPRESWGSEKLTNGEEVGNARDHQGNKERQIPYPAEIARTDEQCYEQNRSERINPAGWSELHRPAVPVCN